MASDEGGGGIALWSAWLPHPVSAARHARRITTWKALSKRHAVPLGRNLDDLRSEWWIITIHANSDNPVCFVMTTHEVRQLAQQDLNDGAYWLSPPAYDRDEFREAWDRMRYRGSINVSGFRTLCF